MSTAYGITGATCWVNVGTPSDIIAQVASGTVGYDTSNTNENGVSGGGLLAGGAISKLIETFGGTLTQSTTASQPILMSFGAWGQGDGSAACIKFANYLGGNPPTTPNNLSEQGNSTAPASSIYLNLPSSCAAFNGSPTGEATIFLAGRFGLIAGGPFVLGDPTFTTQGGVALLGDVNFINDNQDNDQTPQGPPALGYAYSAAANQKSTDSLNSSMIWPNLQPVVMCLRFATSRTGSAVHANQTDFWIGSSFHDIYPDNDMFNCTGVTGGLLGTCSTTSPNQALDCEICEFLVFNRALSNSQVSQIVQTMQDKYCGGFSNQAFVLFFGDSRTRGANPRLGGSNAAPSTFDSASRSWPKRALNQLGGYALGMNMSRIGDSITQQLAQLNTSFSTTNPQYSQILQNLSGKAAVHGSVTYSEVLACGEVGVNDIFFGGQSASQVEANLTTLYQDLLSAGASKVIAMTIVPPAVGTVFGGVTWTTALNNICATVNAWIKNTAPTLIPGVICCDNASDSRYAESGYFDTDGLHFTDAGYGVYAQNTTKSFSTALGLNAVPTTASLNFGDFLAGGQSLTFGSFR